MRALHCQLREAINFLSLCDQAKLVREIIRHLPSFVLHTSVHLKKTIKNIN